MKWKVKWSAPEFPTLESPLEIQVVQAPEPPERVRIEVWESDAKKFEVDDYDNQKLPDGNDDKVAVFLGSLTPHGTRADGYVFEDLDGKPQLTTQQGNDHVFLRFEGEAAGTKYECPIPSFRVEPQEDTDGEFYELYFLIFDADAPTGSKPLVRSQTHFVRRRTDVLLAVEPLNQGTAHLSSPLAKQIFKRYYGGKSTTANRQWGDLLLQVRGQGTSVSIQDSGCSYTVMTMVARYLQVPKPSSGEATVPADVEWETLYDRTAGRTLPAVNAPWQKKKFKKIPKGKEIEGLAKAMHAKRASEWRKKPKAAEPASLTPAPASDPQRPVSDLVVRKEIMPKHWYVPRLLWWVREGDGNGSDPASHFLRGQMRWETYPKGGGKTMEDMVDGAGHPLYRYGFPNETSNGFSRSKDSLLFPPNKGITPDLFKGLGLDFKGKRMKVKDPDWADWVVKHLRRGLPVMAHWKSGRFLREGMDPGGHYTLIVGFRTVDGRRRFIINDPAGARKLQYECLYEDELTPTEGPFDQIQKMEVDVAILDPSAKKKDRVVKEGSATVAAADLGQTQALVLDDAAGRRHRVEFQIDGDWWREGDVRLGALSGSVRYEEDGVELHKDGDVELELKQKARNKTGKARFLGALTLEISDTRSVVLAFKPHTARATGPWPRKRWEGIHNTLVERRRHDTLAGLTVFEPKAGWTKGAARFLDFDGRSGSGSGGADDPGE